MREECKPEVRADVAKNHHDEIKSGQEWLLQMAELKMVEFLNCGIFAYTIPEHRVLAVNDEARRLFQYHSADDRSFYDNMMEHVPQEDYSTMHAVSYHLKKIGDCHRYRFRSRQNDGTTLMLDCYSKLLALEDKKLFIMNVMHDVTEQERMANLLRRERQQYREAVMLNSEYFYELDVTEGIVHSDFTYLKDGVTIASFLDVSFPIQYDELLDRWKEKVMPEFLTPAECNLLTSEELLLRYEQGVAHISAEYYSPPDDKFFRTDTLLSKDAADGHVWAAVFSKDVTESIREETRKRNELAKANRILHKQMEITKAFSSFYMGSCEIDLLTGEVTEIRITEKTRSLFREPLGSGSGAVDVIVRSLVKEEFHGTMREFLCLDTMAERLEGREITSCEYIGKDAGWRRASLIPLKYDENGSLTNVIFAIRGIEAEKQKELDAKRALQEAYEAANRANIIKTGFLVSMSRDVRTPLNAIIGMTAIAGTHLDDRERMENCLSTIMVSARQLLKLIDKVPDVNKMEWDERNLTAERFNVRELADNLLTMSRSLPEYKKQDLSVSIKNMEHENVVGDSRRVQEAFLNLMDNAVKYTPEGGTIKLTVNETPASTSKVGRYEFVFEDNGIGMSKEFLPTIFEPFSRAEDPRAAKVQGTGLGMSVAKNIVHMMNGDIKVESELNRGTKVTVTIMLELPDAQESGYGKDLTNSTAQGADEGPPVGEDTREAPRQSGMQDERVPEDAPAEPGGSRRENFSGYRVLLVEDNESDREIAREILSMTGLEVDCAGDGRQAFDIMTRAERGYYDIIFMDIRMPLMNGYEATRAIRTLPGGYTKQVPIIALTADAFPEDRQAAQNAGMNEHVAKPLDVERLMGLLNRWLGC